MVCSLKTATGLNCWMVCSLKTATGLNCWMVCSLKTATGLNCWMVCWCVLSAFSNNWLISNVSQISATHYNWHTLSEWSGELAGCREGYLSNRRFLFINCCTGKQERSLDLGNEVRSGMWLVNDWILASCQPHTRSPPDNQTPSWTNTHFKPLLLYKHFSSQPAKQILTQT